MSILVTRCLRRSHLVEELVETWQLDHTVSQTERDLEDLASECLELCHLLKKVWHDLNKRLFDEQIDDVDAAGRVMLAAANKALQVFQIVQQQVTEATNKGYRINGLDPLQSAAREMWIVN